MVKAIRVVVVVGECGCGQFVVDLDPVIFSLIHEHFHLLDAFDANVAMGQESCDVGDHGWWM